MSYSAWRSDHTLILVILTEQVHLNLDFFSIFCCWVREWVFFQFFEINNDFPVLVLCLSSSASDITENRPKRIRHACKSWTFAKPHMAQPAHKHIPIFLAFISGRWLSSFHSSIGSVALALRLCAMALALLSNRNVFSEYWQPHTMR